MKLLPIVLMLVLVLGACETTEKKEANPAADGFNLVDSDAKAIEIADAVMEASGGREAWDNTDYLQWRFFGNRLHTWNKATGDVIINSEKDSFEYRLNLNTMAGSVMIGSEELGPLEGKEKYLKRAKEYWINDSYWIFLPFKLKDSGVTLKYKGAGKSKAGEDAELLELTFANVGVTPENKYIVYVDKSTNLICQWDFFRNYEDEEPAFSSPWTDYQDFNGIKLAASRGDGRGMQDIFTGEALAAKFN